MTTIADLDREWIQFLTKQHEKYHPCDRCNKSVQGKEMNAHYWSKHPLWMFNRRTGIHRLLR